MFEKSLQNILLNLNTDRHIFIPFIGDLQKKCLHKHWRLQKKAATLVCFSFLNFSESHVNFTCKPTINLSALVFGPPPAV